MPDKEKPQSTVKEPDLSGTYKASDYLKWNLDELIELIRGKIFKMTPAPSSNHQQISVQLTSILFQFFKGRKCKVFHAPYDVYLSHRGEDYMQTKNVVEPDLCVICDPKKIQKFGCVGAPDLVIEILSPSTSHKDQKDKFELYEEYGVKEYWIVSPESCSVTVHILENGRFEIHYSLTERETLTSKIFPGLRIDLEGLFKNLSDH